MTRLPAILLLSLLAAVVLASLAIGGTEQKKTVAASRYWAQRSRADDLQQRLTVRVLEVRRLSSTWRPTVSYAIRLASALSGVPRSELWAVAECETGGTFSPFAANHSSSASGLFQFLDSTWARAGVPGFSVFDPIANAIAAARLVVRDGGWHEWSCGYAAR